MDRFFQLCGFQDSMGDQFHINFQMPSDAKGLEPFVVVSLIQTAMFEWCG